MDTDGRVALVTGAGQRLGRAIAIGLAEAGCDVAVHYRSSGAGAAATAAEIAGLGRRAVPLAADLARPEEIERLFRDLKRELGRLDLLVNSAASFEAAEFDSIDVEEWDRVQAVNLRAPFLCTQRAARLMAERAGDDGPGLIVNLVDLSGLTPWNGRAHHAVAKAGLAHLTRVAARELAPRVRVNAVVPGAILPPPGVEPTAPAWRETGERMPLGRVGEPADVVAAVLYLARNDFVTGEALVVDGGERLLGAGHH